MRKIRGYVCLAITETAYGNREIPFGKNINFAEKGKLWENFQSNRLVPFGSLQEALVAKQQLEERKAIDFLSVVIAEVKMVIMENIKELPFFENKKNLVVVRLEEEFMLLVGRYVEGKHGLYPLPGAELEFNGMEAIPSFERAREIFFQINRQGQDPALMATFKLKRL